MIRTRVLTIFGGCWLALATATTAHGVEQILLTDGSGLRFQFDVGTASPTFATAEGACTDAEYIQDVTGEDGFFGKLREAFDGYYGLRVNNILYTGNGAAVRDCNDRNLALGVQTNGTLSVQRKVFVPDTDEFCRWLNIVSNTGSTTVGVTMEMEGNLGSDIQTRIGTSSSGDAVVTTADTWFTTFSQIEPTPSQRVRLGHVVQTVGSAVKLANISVQDGNDVVRWSYVFDLAPGETRIIMTFVTGQPTRAEAATKAALLVDLPTTVVQCMSETEIAQLANVSFPDCNDNLVNDADELDTDSDGVIDACDNCDNTANADQVDGDGDGVGNACDKCPNVADATQADGDNDGVGDACDNAPVVPNPDQGDDDGDDVPDAVDNAPDVPNPDQGDQDDDSVGDVIDNAPTTPNPTQEDKDDDGVGDVIDNAPNTPNADQADGDDDGVGDVADNCPGRSNTDQADGDGDLIGDACDPDPVSACGTCGPMGMTGYFLWVGAYGGVIAKRRQQRRGRA